MPGEPFPTLRDERYISLETFKRDGAGVRTPVWFAHLREGLVIFTDGTSYKVKRIRRDSRARVAACGAAGRVHGEWLDGKAEIVSDPGLEKQAYDALLAKYGWQMRVTNLASRIGGSMKRRKIIRVLPV